MPSSRDCYRVYFLMFSLIVGTHKFIPYLINTGSPLQLDGTAEIKVELYIIVEWCGQTIPPLSYNERGKSFSFNFNKTLAYGYCENEKDLCLQQQTLPYNL